MGVLYSISTVSAFDEDDDIGVDLSNYREKSSRNPTVEELKEIANSFCDYQVEWLNDDNNTLIASIIDTQSKDGVEERTTLAIMNEGVEGKEDYYIEKGTPLLMIEFVHRIASICGCQVVFPDTGDIPLIVDSCISPKELLTSWKDHLA